MTSTATSATTSNASSGRAKLFHGDSLTTGDAVHHGKIVVMDDGHDATTRGLYMNDAIDSNWTMYLAASSNDWMSPSGGVPPDGIVFDGEALRIRVDAASNRGLIVENSRDECLASLRGSDARVTFTGDVAVSSNLVLVGDAGVRVVCGASGAAPLPLSFYVGSNPDAGDFATIQQAVNALAVSTKSADGIPVEIVVRDGYVLPGGIVCRDGDFGHLSIRAETASCNVMLDSNAYTDAAASALSPAAVVHIINARGPSLDCLFDAGNLTTQPWNGVAVRGAGAALHVSSGAGVTRAPRDGLVVLDGGTVYCESGGAVFYESGGCAVRVENQSRLTAENLDARKASDSGARVKNGSTAMLAGADFSGCKCASSTYGVVISGASVADLHDAMLNVDASSNFVDVGLHVARASHVDAVGLMCGDESGASNLMRAVQVDGMSYVDMEGATLYGWSDYAVAVSRGAAVDVTSNFVDAASTAPISVSDTNVTSFNIVTENGVIYRTSPF